MDVLWQNRYISKVWWNLRPKTQVVTVVNTYGGELETAFIEDGSIVNEGDIPYKINHDELLVELEYYNEQLIRYWKRYRYV